MAPRKPSVLAFQNLPYDMLSLILSKVGSTSSVDYVNTKLTCKNLNISFEDYFVAKDLNLEVLVQNPRHARNYRSLMESCLRSNNGNAHYVQAAKGGHKAGRFLYGILLMSFGMADKGKKVLTRLTNEHGGATVELIWGNVRSSLNGFDLHMKKVYHQSLAKMRPVLDCCPPELNTPCSSCFHYYFLNQFVNLMMGFPANG